MNLKDEVGGLGWGKKCYYMNDMTKKFLTNLAQDNFKKKLETEFYKLDENNNVEKIEVTVKKKYFIVNDLKFTCKEIDKILFNKDGILVGNLKKMNNIYIEIKFFNDEKTNEKKLLEIKENIKNGYNEDFLKNILLSFDIDDKIKENNNNKGYIKENNNKESFKKYLSILSKEIGIILKEQNFEFNEDNLLLEYYEYFDDDQLKQNFFYYLHIVLEIIVEQSDDGTSLIKNIIDFLNNKSGYYKLVVEKYKLLVRSYEEKELKEKISNFRKNTDNFKIKFINFLSSNAITYAKDSKKKSIYEYKRIE